MIRRVLNVYLAEVRKLRHRAIGYAAFGSAIATVVLGVLFTRVGEAAGRLQGGARAVQEANGFVAFADGLGYGVGVGAIFLLIFAGLFMAEETELGTAKILFSKPVRRVEVVIAKGLLLLTLSIALVALVAAASAAAAGAVYGFGDVVERDAHGEVFYVHHTAEVMFGHVLRTVPQLVPPLFAALAIAFLMSTLAEQSGIAVGLSFGLLVVSMAATWLFDRAAPYLVTSYFGFPTETLRAFATGEATAQWDVHWPKGPPKLALGLAVSAGYTLLAWAIAAIAVSRRAILALLLGASLALVALAPPRAAFADDEKKPMRFSTGTLEVPGQVWDVTPIDVDMDGLDELVVFHVIGRKGPDPRRFLSIFYGRPGAGPGGGRYYPERPDQTIEIPGDACVRFVADVDPRVRGRELGFVGPRGAFCYATSKAAPRRFDTVPRRLFEDDGFFDIAAGTQLPDWSGLVKDVDGDGLVDVVFPKKGAFALYVQKKDGGFERALELPLEWRQLFGTRIETLLLNRFINYWAALSKPALADIDGNRRLDIVTFHDGGLDVFLQKAAMPDPRARFGQDPDRRMKLKVVSDAQSGEANDEYNSVNAAFEDVDGDGLADLVLYRNVGKVGLFESMRTQVILYRGRPKQGWLEDRPDQVLNLKGVSINPALIDVDKDGKKDLVVSSLRTDLVTNAKRALFKSVGVTYYVFLYDPDERRFHENPDYARDLTIDVERIEGGGTIPLAFFWGDYDGDGYPDLLSLEDEREVTIDPGRVEESFFGGKTLDYDEGERCTIEIETSNSIKIWDLNHDGRSDFVFWYFDKNWESKERGTIRVVMAE